MALVEASRAGPARGRGWPRKCRLLVDQPPLRKMGTSRSSTRRRPGCACAGVGSSAIDDLAARLRSARRDRRSCRPMKLPSPRGSGGLAAGPASRSWPTCSESLIWCCQAPPGSRTADELVDAAERGLIVGGDEPRADAPHIDARALLLQAGDDVLVEIVAREDGGLGKPASSSIRRASMLSQARSPESSRMPASSWPRSRSQRAHLDGMLDAAAACRRYRRGRRIVRHAPRRRRERPPLRCRTT